MGSERESKQSNPKEKISIAVPDWLKINHTYYRTERPSEHFAPINRFSRPQVLNNSNGFEKCYVGVC